MKYKQLKEEGQKVYALIFDPGDELISELEKFSRENDLLASSFKAIGAFQKATLAFFDPETHDYLEIPINEQVEVLSLVGDVSTEEGQPKIHAHVVVGQRDGNARGGHILSAYVWPTLEVVLEETPDFLRRKVDPETGLSLIDIEQGEMA